MTQVFNYQVQFENMSGIGNVFNLVAPNGKMFLVGL